MHMLVGDEFFKLQFFLYMCFCVFFLVIVFTTIIKS